MRDDHNWDEMADMKAIGGWIEAYVKRDILFIQKIFNFFFVCGLCNETSLL